MLTEKQKINISKLDNESLKEILDIWIEELGVCDVKECCHALGVQRSRIYQIMNSKNTLKIGEHKFLMINET